MNLLILKKYDCKKIKNIHEVYLSAFSSSHFQTLKRKDFEDFYRMDAKIFMLYIKKSDAKETNLSIDEGLKIVISGGMLAPKQNEI